MGQPSERSVRWLRDRTAFPPPEWAREDGLLAVGGDLAPDRLLAAYAQGIFPWYEEGVPILWWCPEPRFVLFPEELRVSRSLGKRLRSGRYQVRLDTRFGEVIRACATAPRSTGIGTWITRDMVSAYCLLSELGFAHSAEAFLGDQLVGGLYGVSLGRVFFGESMFARKPDASKVALVTLVRQLAAWGFDLIDCQMPTEHLASLGAREIPRAEFLRRLARALEGPTRRGRWRLDD